nr:hypothetical protein [Tanacetum cinerariifolium]
MNQDEVNVLRAERLVKTHDPSALMAHSQNSYNFLATHNDQSSSSTHSQQSFPINNKYNPQPSFNQNFMQPPMNSLNDNIVPTEAINASRIFFAKAFQLTNQSKTTKGPHLTHATVRLLSRSGGRASRHYFGTESDKFIKSCAENLVPNPSESEGENGCDVLACFTTFSNVLFDADYDSDSSDDQSLFDEDVPEKIYSNPFFDEEIIPMEIDQRSFNAESDLIESMPNHDSSVIIYLKIDSLFDEFANELTLLTSISPGIDETDCHPEEEIRLARRLLYDNSFPRPPKELVFDNSNSDIESFSPSSIPIKDSDSHMEEIDLPFTPDDPMPPGIEEDDYDSGRDIPILEKLLDNYSLSLPASESYHFDISSPYRPPAKPPDGTWGSSEEWWSGAENTWEVELQLVPVVFKDFMCKSLWVNSFGKVTEIVPKSY